MKTYVFQVELETDGEGWRAFFPEWETLGGSTWGYTQEETLKNIQEVLSMIVEKFLEEEQTIPTTKHVTVAAGAAVAVTV